MVLTGRVFPFWGLLWLLPALLTTFDTLTSRFDGEEGGGLPRASLGVGWLASVRHYPSRLEPRNKTNELVSLQK